MTGTLARTQPVEDVRRFAAERGLVLRRAWPRDLEHLLLDLVPRGGGAAVAGQWFAQPGRAKNVAEQTSAAVVQPGRPHAVVCELRSPLSAVVLQPEGADRRLPGLVELVGRPGASLICHRPERRGVVRHLDIDGPAEGRTSPAEGQIVYSKVVRASRLSGVVAAIREAATTGLSVPIITDVDAERCSVTTAQLPGRTLHEILADPATPRAGLLLLAGHVGAMLTQLHACPPSDGAQVHDAAADVRITERWLGHAAAYGLLDATVLRRLPALLVRARGLLAQHSMPLGRLHRDMHDKQVLYAEGLCGEKRGLSLIDFDTSAVGEPALDLANLMVHLRLRAAQGLLDPVIAEECAEAVLEGYGPTIELRERLIGYELLTQLRLVGVYAFRGTVNPAAALIMG